jgi:catechol 2,3-dioxygenase
MAPDPVDPEELTAAGAPAAAALPPDTRVGAVHLTVSDLERSLGFYEWALGLRVLRREDSRATLGAGGPDLLVLIEEPGARPARRTCGLYHYALLVPERRDLARWLLHVANERVPLAGLSDHFVSEAIYLSDPDEHGIEVYWDRPREQWEGQVAERMTTLPLDVDSLLAELDEPPVTEFEGLPPGTVMGHLHLRVSAIPATIAFYRDVLGFGVMASLGAQAVFLSAGGYHHHVGANAWESAGAPPAPPGTARLLQATVLLPDETARDALAARVAETGQDPEPLPGGTGVLVRDPSGNPVALELAP